MSAKLNCAGCGKPVGVTPWKFGPFVTHPNRRCADAAESATQECPCGKLDANDFHALDCALNPITAAYHASALEEEGS